MSNRLLLQGMILAVIPVLLICMSGCRKNTAIDLNPNLNACNDNVVSYRAFVQIFALLVKASADTGIQHAGQGVIDRALITYDSLENRYTFQYQGQICPDSVKRYGYYIIDLDGPLFTPGVTGSAAFFGYAEDNHVITGTDSIETLIQSGSISTFSNRIRNTVITKDSVRLINLDMNLLFTVDLSLLYQDSANASVGIQGTADGITSMGLVFSSAVTTALEYYFNCPWIRKGVISLEVPSIEIPVSSIVFQGQSGCTDSVNYDFGNVIYRWRIARDFLSH